MKRTIILASVFAALLLALAGCKPTGMPLHSPPPPGAAHDQATGVHRGLSPLYNKELKNPPPYLNTGHHEKFS